MTCTWVKNGCIKLIIRPDDKIEESLMAELLKGPIEGTIVAVMQVGDIQYSNSMIITTQAPVKTQQL